MRKIEKNIKNFIIDKMQDLWFSFLLLDKDSNQHEIKFLEKIYDLKSLPSNDPRYDNAYQDIYIYIYTEFLTLVIEIMNEFFMMID